jgi:hypothetical protein
MQRGTLLIMVFDRGSVCIKYDTLYDCWCVCSMQEYRSLVIFKKRTRRLQQ